MEQYESLYRAVLTSIFTAAIMTTAVPFLWALLPWFKSRVGKAFMLQAIAFAVIVDTTLIFYFWRPNLGFILWVNLFAFTFVTVGSGRVAYKIGKSLFVKNYRMVAPSDDRTSTRGGSGPAESTSSQ